MSERRLAELLRRLFAAYRNRFDAVAPRVDPPVPALAQKQVDVVSVNGGQAVHFFFSDPSVKRPVAVSAPTRLHNVTMWPEGTHRLRAMAREEPGPHRDQVRRTARIRGGLYVHFVLFPEDGNLEDVVGVVGERLAEREVARAAGRTLPADVPGEAVDAAAWAREARAREERPWDAGLDPAP